LNKWLLEGSLASCVHISLTVVVCEKARCAVMKRVLLDGLFVAPVVASVAGVARDFLWMLEKSPQKYEKPLTALV